MENGQLENEGAKDTGILQRAACVGASLTLHKLWASARLLTHALMDRWSFRFVVLSNCWLVSAHAQTGPDATDGIRQSLR